MPIINITIVEGREEKVVQQCIKAVANTVHKELNAPLSSIRVSVNEVPPNRFAVGNQLKSEEKK